METKPIFNLHLTYEEALKSARTFKAEHKSDDGKELYIWEDPRNYCNERMMFRLDGFFPRTFDDDIKECFTPGDIDKEAKAALLYLIDRHKGFNALELGQVIVGVQNFGSLQGDQEVAIFTYLSREDDCLRDFITEKAYDLIHR